MLLGGHPPAIFPVCAALPEESDTVHNLVRTVNLILARLRSCGVLANHAEAQGQLSFQQIGKDQDSFASASGDCRAPLTIPQAALQAFLQQNPSPVLRRVLQLWQALSGPGPAPNLDRQAFTQLFTQALFEEQQAAAAP